MKKYYSIFLFLFFVTGFACAQSMYEMREAIDFFRSNKLQSGGNRFMLTEDEIEGSPYLNKDFIKGSLFTVMKQQYVDLPLRYNIYSDEIEFKSESDEIQALSSPEIVEYVEFGGNKMVYIPFSILKKIRKGYFIVLEEGNASLYMKPEIIFKDAVQPAAYKDAEPAQFVKKSDSYYIRVGLEQAKIVDNKKEMIEIFPDNRDKIEEFIKKEKTKTNSPESLKEVVKYYNSL